MSQERVRAKKEFLLSYIRVCLIGSILTSFAIIVLFFLYFVLTNQVVFTFEQLKLGFESSFLLLFQIVLPSTSSVWLLFKFTTIIITKLDSTIETQLKKIWSLDQRIIISDYFDSTLALLFLVFLAMLLYKEYADDSVFFLIPLTGIGIGLIFSGNIINNHEWSCYYLNKFKEDSTDVKSLDKALGIINNILKNSFDDKKLHLLSQNIGRLLDITDKPIENDIDELIKFVENAEDTKISGFLLNLSKTTQKGLKEYRDYLGIKIDLPLRLKIVDSIKAILKSTKDKVYENILYVIIVIMISILFRGYIDLEEIINILIPK